MTKEEKYTLAKWAMNHALENGAQQASVNISNSRSSSVEVREEKIDKLEQAIQSGLNIRLYVDNKYSAHSTNRLKKEELARFIEQAIEGTRFYLKTNSAHFPNLSYITKGGNDDLKTLDSGFSEVDPQKKIDLAFTVEKEVLGKDDRIISVSTGYYDGLEERVMVTSNGFEGDSANSYFGLYASVSVKSDDARPESSWSESSVFFDNLKKDEIGLTALKRATNKIGQAKIASEKMTMIVENKQVGRLFSPLIQALNGSAIQQKTHF
jgi:PmbA protein